MEQSCQRSSCWSWLRRTSRLDQVGVLVFSAALSPWLTAASFHYLSLLRVYRPAYELAGLAFTMWLAWIAAKCVVRLGLLEWHFRGRRPSFQAMASYCTSLVVLYVPCVIGLSLLPITAIAGPDFHHLCFQNPHLKPIAYVAIAMSAPSLPLLLLFFTAIEEAILPIMVARNCGAAEGCLYFAQLLFAKPRLLFPRITGRLALEIPITVVWALTLAALIEVTFRLPSAGPTLVDSLLPIAVALTAVFLPWSSLGGLFSLDTLQQLDPCVEAKPQPEWLGFSSTQPNSDRKQV